MRYFLVLLVVKTVPQKKQVFEEVPVILESCEESIKKDNHRLEVKCMGIALKFDIHTTFNIGCLLYFLRFSSCWHEQNTTGKPRESGCVRAVVCDHLRQLVEHCTGHLFKPSSRCNVLLTELSEPHESSRVYVGLALCVSWHGFKSHSEPEIFFRSLKFVLWVHSHIVMYTFHHYCWTSIIMFFSCCFGVVKNTLLI